MPFIGSFGFSSFLVVSTFGSGGRSLSMPFRGLPGFLFVGTLLMLAINWPSELEHSWIVMDPSAFLTRSCKPCCPLLFVSFTSLEFITGTKSTPETKITNHACSRQVFLEKNFAVKWRVWGWVSHDDDDDDTNMIPLGWSVLAAQPKTEPKIKFLIGRVFCGTGHKLVKLKGIFTRGSRCVHHWTWIQKSSLFCCQLDNLYGTTTVLRSLQNLQGMLLPGFIQDLEMLLHT